MVELVIWLAQYLMAFSHVLYVLCSIHANFHPSKVQWNKNQLYTGIKFIDYVLSSKTKVLCLCYKLLLLMELG